MLAYADVCWLNTWDVFKVRTFCLTNRVVVAMHDEIPETVLTCTNRYYQPKREHLSHNKQGWHGKVWMGRSTGEVELADGICYVFPCSPPHTHTHTPRRCHQPQHTRHQLLRRQRISSVSYRTGASSTRCLWVVFHIDCGITDTKATTLSQLPRLWNGSRLRTRRGDPGPGTPLTYRCISVTPIASTTW